MEEANYIEKVTTLGNMPVAKFGHTATQISRDKIIIFGGASGNVDTYSITNECFCLDIESEKSITFTWRKLQNTGTIPCSRAAHSCCKIEENRMLFKMEAKMEAMFAKGWYARSPSPCACSNALPQCSKMSLVHIWSQKLPRSTFE